MAMFAQQPFCPHILPPITRLPSCGLEHPMQCFFHVIQMWWSTHFPYFGKPDLKMLTLKRVNLWHYFLQYLIHFIVIFSIAKTRLQRIWAGAYSVESTVLICIFKPRLCMCTLCSHQMPAGEHFLHCCIPTAVAQISKFEPTACLKQSPQKKE